MTQQKYLVFTTKGTYRLWDNDIINCIDLSDFKNSFVASILTDKQKCEICDYAATRLTDKQKCEICDYAATRLTDKQYESMREHFILPEGF